MSTRRSRKQGPSAETGAAPSAFHKMSDDTLQELQRAIGRIEGKLDNLVGLPQRVSRLENWRSFLAGAWAVTTIVGAAAWAMVKNG